MKNIQNKLIPLFLVVVAAFFYGFSQNDVKHISPSFDIHQVYPPVSITKTQLTSAKRLIDLNDRYTPSWVRTYISVEISTNHKGKIKKAVGKSNILTKAQKKLMNAADIDKEITVKVKYMPENTLKHNDAKEINFTFTIEPKTRASYSAGKQALSKYLSESAVSKIPSDVLKKYDLAAVKFTVNEKGEIVNPHVFQSTKNEKVDKILLETIKKMPKWKPAKYANGLKIKQDFMFTVGNMESCVVNTLGIRHPLKD